MSTNDITGDEIRTEVPSEKYKSGWDAIWGKKKVEEPVIYKISDIMADTSHEAYEDCKEMLRMLEAGEIFLS